MFVRSLAFTLFALTSMVGCASNPPPRVVRVSDVGDGPPLLPGQALVIEFQENDRLPLSFVLAGPLLVTEGDTALTLRATRRFFLRVDEDGIATSLDGHDFSKGNGAPGSFQAGISATKEGVRANVTIKGPTPNGLTAN